MGGKRIKRQQVQSTDGWTVITHGLSNMSLSSKDASKADAVGAMPTQTVKDLTPEKLLRDFVLLQERWEDTALAAQVKELIQGKQWGVRSAMCIGIGSFSRDWAHRWRSIWQLVLFVDVVRLLKKEGDEEGGGGDIACFAQDPAFTPLDTEFLSLLSIATLTSDLQTKITPASFVYSPFVDWFLLLPTFLARRNPVLYVGNEILDDYAVYAQSKEKRERLDECNEVGRKWLEQREMLRLREFEKHANALNGMVVYWRTGFDDEVEVKEEGSEEEGEKERKGGGAEGESKKDRAEDEVQEKAEDDVSEGAANEVKDRVGDDSKKEKLQTGIREEDNKKSRNQGSTHSAEQDA